MTNNARRHDNPGRIKRPRPLSTAHGAANSLNLEALERVVAERQPSDVQSEPTAPCKDWAARSWTTQTSPSAAAPCGAQSARRRGWERRAIRDATPAGRPRGRPERVLAGNETAKRIASRLGRHPQTVRQHLYNLEAAGSVERDAGGGELHWRARGGDATA